MTGHRSQQKGGQKLEKAGTQFNDKTISQYAEKYFWLGMVAQTVVTAVGKAEAG